jgi:hypothetical protein
MIFQQLPVKNKRGGTHPLVALPVDNFPTIFEIISRSIQEEEPFCEKGYSSAWKKNCNATFLLFAEFDHRRDRSKFEQADWLLADSG